MKKPPKKPAPQAAHMSYEAHLDEVATLLTELYDLTDDEAIQMVMRAQEAEYFSGHDDNPAICTQARAEEDTHSVFKHHKK